MAEDAGPEPEFEPDPEEPLDGELETNGFTLALPPLAAEIGQVKGSATSCLLICALVLSEFKGEPDFTAKMKLALELEKSMDPPSQVWQLLQSTFAVILPLLTPDPSRSVI